MITDDEIKEIHTKILQGESVKSATKTLDISVAYYYQRIKKLGLSTKRKSLEKKRNSGVKKIKDMHDLAYLLNTDFKELHKYLDTESSVEKNIKKMNYLKNHSPKKFQEAVQIIILNFYKLDAIKLIKTLKNM
ncbi:MAG: hypothetical protein LWW95_11430 [Candidatus Desulfofervidus auxilii]|nr:hypothetical protein [Candidatus Desulfofervidus auxilii]